MLPRPHPNAAAVLLLAAAAAAACRRSAPEAPPATQVPPPVEVLKDGRWLFTYVEPGGVFATTDKPELVPEPSRKIARVTDPSRSAAERRDTTDVYVADLNVLLKSGKTATKVLAREAFETAALLQLPPGDNSLRSAAPSAGSPEPPAAAPGGDGGSQGGAPTGGPPVVTIYGTSWCGACRSARQYFAGRKIPFADKDVERDPAAARELGEKAARLGIPTDRVPILDVRGRLLVGFDRARVETLLGEAT